MSIGLQSMRIRAFRNCIGARADFCAKLTAFSVVYYFLLPIGAAYCTQLFKTQVWGPVNFGILFALSEFVVAWIIAYLYRAASARFDPMAEELARTALRTRAVS